MAKKKAGTPKSIARDIAEYYCKKFKESPDLTLSKILYRDNPKVFKSVEHARNFVRAIRGHYGERQRKLNCDKSLFKPITNNTNPFGLPESHSLKANKWKLPKAYGKTLVLSDIHFPYQDNEALTAILNYGKEKDIDSIFINGDMLDFYQLSFHEKDPRKTSIPDELDMGRQFFKMLRKEFKGAAIYYIMGNHEYRLERYLRVKAPELLNMEEFKMDILLRCGEYGVNYIPYGSKCYFGKLLVEHGDKMKGSGGMNPARTLSLKFKRPTLCGHFHRTSSSNASIYDDSSIMCWSTGCLCELEPGYMPLNEHNHGGAIIETDHTSDSFRVENFMIINGRVY